MRKIELGGFIIEAARPHKKRRIAKKWLRRYGFYLTNTNIQTKPRKLMPFEDFRSCILMMADFEFVHAILMGGNLFGAWLFGARSRILDPESRYAMLKFRNKIKEIENAYNT